jgi:hypothetical protein
MTNLQLMLMKMNGHNEDYPFEIVDYKLANIDGNGLT